MLSQQKHPRTELTISFEFFPPNTDEGAEKLAATELTAKPVLARLAEADKALRKVEEDLAAAIARRQADKTALRAEDWHTDDSYFAVPAKATLLHAIEIPSRGGATWFCNMHSVFEALPEPLRSLARRSACAN